MVKTIKYTICFIGLMILGSCNKLSVDVLNPINPVCYVNNFKGNWFLVSTSKAHWVGLDTVDIVAFNNQISVLFPQQTTTNGYHTFYIEDIECSQSIFYTKSSLQANSTLEHCLYFDYKSYYNTNTNQFEYENLLAIAQIYNKKDTIAIHFYKKYLEK